MSRLFSISHGRDSLSKGCPILMPHYYNEADSNSSLNKCRVSEEVSCRRDKERVVIFGHRNS